MLKKKLSLLPVTLLFFSLQSFRTPPVPVNSPETHASYLAVKFGIDNKAIQLALSGYEKLKQWGLLHNLRYLTIADFSKPSNTKRLSIIDMEQQQVVLQTYVAHGRNSGTLFAKHFSNKNASYESSLGFYITGSPYFGKHGKSLELKGIEPGINDHAKQRAIVLHGAEYVSPHAIAQLGFLGRSQGCPAVPQDEVEDIIATIQDASCLFIYAPDQHYLQSSRLVN
ncbi:MAG: murein L,D-transpeptidase catalytic domain family protein [Bacteroidota bacterium]|nr:murein L,D-transpeptidase catalytic domain family protein [Bacteroidota bacterium]